VNAPEYVTGRAGGIEDKEAVIPVLGGFFTGAFGTAAEAGGVLSKNTAADIAFRT